jgi:hypothetical protein
MRDTANTGWIMLAYFDVGSGQWELRSDVIQAVSAAGVTIKDSSGADLFTIAASGQITVTGTIAGLDAAAAKATPIDADSLTILDSAAASILKKVTWANVKATLKTYFDTLYAVYATATAKGPVELATTAEGDTGTSTTLVPPVDVVKSMIATHAVGIETFQSKVTLASDTEADFALASADEHIFRFKGVIPATDGASFYMRASDDDKSTFETITYSVRDNNQTTPTSGSGVSATLAETGVGSGASEYGAIGELVVSQISGDYALINWQITYISSTGNVRTATGGGYVASVSALTDVRFLFNTGFMETGEIYYTSRTFS